MSIERVVTIRHWSVPLYVIGPAVLQHFSTPVQPRLCVHMLSGMHMTISTHHGAFNPSMHLACGMHTRTHTHRERKTEKNSNQQYAHTTIRIVNDKKFQLDKLSTKLPGPFKALNTSSGTEDRNMLMHKSKYAIYVPPHILGQIVQTWVPRRAQSDGYNFAALCTWDTVGPAPHWNVSGIKTHAYH